MNHRDYSLVGTQSKLSVENGLAEANWYRSPVPRNAMQALLTRKNSIAIRDTIIWLGLLFTSGLLALYFWGSWLSVVFFAIYGVLYASCSDSRWHESSHGTAFKTDWMNNTLYEVASFMVMRESIPWRWSHTRHHSDTNIVGRDPEIAVPVPSNLRNIALAFFNLRVIPNYFKNILIHCSNRMTLEEQTYVPESEYKGVYFNAKVYLTIYLAIIALSLYFSSIIPLLFIGLPNIYGAWLMPIYGLTQHAGMPENVLDHRLNCRTVKMNALNRFLYWNMNYHVEHHMFPQVPYHALPQLHDIVKDDMPTPYSSIAEAYKEIIYTVVRQTVEPEFHVLRNLPAANSNRQAVLEESHIIFSTKDIDPDGWVELGNKNEINVGEVVRFDHGRQTYAIYRTEENQFYATDGMCTHGNTHLATGLLVNNTQIECPKHNGRFDIRDGSPKRSPICVGLKTFAVKFEDNTLWINILHAGGVGAVEIKKYQFEVVSNDNVATFIKELVLKPIDHQLKVTPGDYLQLEIPTYENILFKNFSIDDKYGPTWLASGVLDDKVSNSQILYRNYSLASNHISNDSQGTLYRFNVRIALASQEHGFPAGVGSSYIFNLKAGDNVNAIGPFGDFHIKPTQKEMIYIGGGAGMAPLCSHLSALFESHKTKRKVSYWYGARSVNEMFYQEYFNELAERFSNFSFHVALSDTNDDFDEFHQGFIHQVLFEQYLNQHSALQTIEFYLCGPPLMIEATTAMLTSLGVEQSQIAYDEF